MQLSLDLGSFFEIRFSLAVEYLQSSDFTLTEFLSRWFVLCKSHAKQELRDNA